MPIEVSISEEQFKGRASRRYSPAAVLMNLTTYPLLVVWTLLGILCFPLGFVLWKLFFGWDSGRIMRHFIWIYGRGWLQIMSPFVRFRREGFENLETDVPCILVVNHLSFFDTYCMGLLPIHDIVFAVRSWPFRMFWYGWFMRLAGYLDVESSEWGEIHHCAAEIAAENGHLLFFPEGHRSRSGDLQHFSSGAFRLAVDLKMRMIPLCISGTDRLLPPGRFWLQPTEITMRALPPLEGNAFAGSDGARELRKQVKNRMAESLEHMREGEA